MNEWSETHYVVADDEMGRMWVVGMCNFFEDEQPKKSIRLLGKDLSEYYLDIAEKREIERSQYAYAVAQHNIQATKKRLQDEDFEDEINSLFVYDGNEINHTAKIIASVRVALEKGLLTDEQWERAIPIIENGLTMNKGYVELCDKLQPIIEEYCQKYGNLFRYTLKKRFELEFWQGRFSHHPSNPKQEIEYK